MPKITFIDGASGAAGGAGGGERRIEVEVPAGTTLLEAARRGRAPVGSACGGVCACSTCHVHVTRGGASLSERQDREEDILDKAFDVRSSSRLGCQARVGAADVEVAITRESRQAYLDEHPEERRQATEEGRP